MSKKRSSRTRWFWPARLLLLFDSRAVKQGLIVVHLVTRFTHDFFIWIVDRRLISAVLVFNTVVAVISGTFVKFLVLFCHFRFFSILFKLIYSASGSLLAHGLSKTFYRVKETMNFKRSLEYWNWFREIFHCVVSCLIHRRSGGALLSIGRAGHVWRRPGRLAPS